jgi:predicted nucleic acid-binding protein
MAFVVDASVALSWYFTDETSSTGELAFDRLRGSEAVAPISWWFEIHNALLASERRGRIGIAQTAAILTSVSALPVRLEAIERDEPILALARVHRLTFYGTAYLELAHRLGAPLATSTGPSPVPPGPPPCLCSVRTKHSAARSRRAPVRAELRQKRTRCRALNPGRVHRDAAGSRTSARPRDRPGS